MVLHLLKNEDFIIHIDSLIQERTQYFNEKTVTLLCQFILWNKVVFDYNSPFDLNLTIRLHGFIHVRKKRKNIYKEKKEENYFEKQNKSFRRQLESYSVFNQYG